MLQQWIKALREGQFHQTRFALQKQIKDAGRCYCALGVLCEINDYILDVDSHNFLAKEGETCPDGKYNSNGELLVTSYYVHNFINGLTAEMEDKITALNDHHNKSFSEIADYLEEHYTEV